MAEPPSDFEAEKKVIGALLLRPDAVGDIMADLSWQDFYHKPYALLYAAMCDLVIENQPVTTSTLARKTASLDIGGPATIPSCLEGVLPEEAPFWASRIVAMRKRRSLLTAGEKAVALAQSEEDPDASLAKVEELLATAESRGNDTIDMSAGVDLFLQRVERYLAEPDGLAGLATGWDDLDRHLDGLRPGAITIVYARTSSYKSMFVGNIGWRLARDGVPGMWFTTESPHAEVMERLIQLEAGCNLRELRYRHELFTRWEDIRLAAEDVRQYPIWVCDRSAMELGFVRGAVNHMRRKRQIQYVIVDLVDHVLSSRFRDNDVKNAGYVIQQMKEMAKRESLHVILTTHIRKPDRMLPSSKPYIDLEEMKDTSAKAQDSDAAISLMVVKHDPLDGGDYIPMTREEMIEERRSTGRHLLYAAVTKNRHGDLTNIPLVVDLNSGGYIYAEHDAHRQSPVGVLR